jgi:Sulfotransferase domain
MAIVGRADEISRRVVTGWAADNEKADAELDIAIIVNGREVGKVRAKEMREDVKAIFPGSTGRCGFQFKFDPPLSVFDEFNIEVRVAGANAPIPGGVMKLSRPNLATNSLLPILVTSSGRAGSTVLMQYLSQFPEIVMAMAYPFELKLINYYSAAFGVLAMDEDRVNSTDPGNMFDGKFRNFVGSNPYTRSGHHGGGNSTRTVVRNFFDERVPVVLAETFRNLLLEYYTLLKRDQNKPHARYFAEKGTLEEAARRGPRVLFGTVREIVIVRDPRDLLCSAKAFWKLSSQQAQRLVIESSGRLQEIMQTADKDVMLVKYEDLVIEPERAMQSIADFVGIQRRESFGASPGNNFFNQHSTSGSPQSSVGRWQTDLSSEEIEFCHKRTQSYMEMFGYPLSAAPSATPSAVREKQAAAGS